jgi:GNAT superfamily N-acetyltransferase
MIIRQIKPAEGEQLRAIRLQAVADSPTAFGSTLAETEALSTEDWDHRARGNATGDVAIMFVAEVQGAWIGLAGGMFDQDAHPRTVILFSMWVNPAYRRKRIGRELVHRVMEWSRLRGADRIALWVTENNNAAINLYASCGFTTSDDRQPLPSNPSYLEQRMVLDLSDI